MNYSIDPYYLFDCQYNADIEGEKIKQIFRSNFDDRKKQNNFYYQDEKQYFITAGNLDWDTDHFGIKMAKLDHCYSKEIFPKESWKSLENWLNEEGIKHLSYRTNLVNYKSIEFLVREGFELMTHKLMFRLPSAKFISDTNSFYDEYQKPVSDEILNISENSFSYGRFINDLHIPKQKTKDLYKCWLINSMKNNNKLIVEYNNNKIVGFVLYSIGIKYNKEIDELLPHGFISLIATLPELKGKGIGKKLLNQALSNMFHHYGVKVVFGNTDIMNKNGSGLFQSTGFMLFNILTELRRWYGI